MQRDDHQGAPGARWHPAGWKDPRLMVGIVLVIASVLGVWWLVRSTQHTEAMWTAAVDLPAGAEVRSEDLLAVEVRLGDTTQSYLSADTAPEAGSRLLSPLGKGELLPVSALGRADPAGRRPVSVMIEDKVPAGVQRGGRVDVYATAGNVAAEQEAESRLVLSGVEVTAVTESEDALAGQESTTVDLLVDPDNVADFIRARGAGERMDLVALPPGSTP